MSNTLELLSTVDSDLKAINQEQNENEIDNLRTDFSEVSEAPREQQETTFSERWDAATELEWIHKQINNDYSITHETPLNEKDYKYFIETTPSDYHHIFDEAKSLEQAYRIKERLDVKLKNEAVLNANGAGEAFGIRLMAAVTDPTQLAIGLGTGGLYNFYKAGRISNMTRLGLIAGGESLAIEGLRAQADETVTHEDVIYNTLGAVAFGGALGGLMKPSEELTQAAANVQKQLDSHLAKSTGHTVTEQGKTILNDSPIETSPQLEFDLAGDVLATRGESNDETSLITRSDRVDTFLEGYEDTDKVFAGTANATYSAVLHNSSNPKMRHTMARLLENGAGWNNADTLSPNVATSWRDLQIERFNLRLMKSEETFYNKWAKENKLKSTSAETRRQFYNQVTDAIELDAHTNNPHISGMANELRNFYKEVGTLANNPRALDGKQGISIKGAESFEANPNYVPHIWDTRKIDYAVNKHGEDTVVNLVANSLRQARPDKSPEVYSNIARGVIRTIRNNKFNEPMDVSRWFTLDKDELTEELTERLGDDFSEEVSDLVTTLEKLKENKHNKADTDNRQKSRLSLDMNLIDEATGLRIKDLFQRDSFILMNQYMNSQVGRAALARHGLISEGDIKKLRHEIKTGYAKTSPRVKTELELFDKTIANLLGRAYHAPDTAIAHVSRIGRPLAHANVGGMMGFAQIAELGNVVSAVGVKAFAKHIPSFSKLLGRARNGEPLDDLYRELELVLGGYGSRRFMHKVTHFDEEIEGSVFGKTQGIEQGAKHLSRLVSDLSGMNMITQVLQRVTIKGGLDRILGEAKGGKKFLSEQEYKEIGIDSTMLSRIHTMLNKHVPEGNYMTINWDKWTDREAAENFALLMRRWGQRVVQENTLGDSFIYDGPLAKLFTQFRSFVIGAHSKQLLHGLNHIKNGDGAKVFTKFSLNSFFAGLSWIAYVQSKAQGRPDEQKYLEQNLSDEAIAKAMFSRAGWSGLVPTALDSASDFLTGDQLFNQRTTVESNSMFDFSSTPVGSLVGRTFSGSSALTQNVLTDKPLSQADLNLIKSIAPLQNIILVDGYLRSLIKETSLPRK